MSAVEKSFDTNILLHLRSADETKANRPEEELSAGGIVSVQILNEFASVASRRLDMSIAEIREVLAGIRAASRIVPIGQQTHDSGLDVAERYRLSVRDAMIVAAALLAGCHTLLSEDIQNGQTIDGMLEVRNPFR